MRPVADRSVVEWAHTQSAFTVSVVTVEEICFGLAARPSGRLERWFEAFLAAHCEVLPVTDRIARRSGALRAGLRARGHVRTQADMLIAATALEHRLTVATRNMRDFLGCGVRVVDPFRH
jgi:predicted nucleic acid-binding protein